MVPGASKTHETRSRLLQLGGAHLGLCRPIPDVLVRRGRHGGGLPISERLLNTHRLPGVLPWDALGGVGHID